MVLIVLRTSAFINAENGSSLVSRGKHLLLAPLTFYSPLLSTSNHLLVIFAAMCNRLNARESLHVLNISITKTHMLFHLTQRKHSGMSGNTFALGM